eukprot:9490327-Prorocentrum_lima.AAC.1
MIHRQTGAYHGANSNHNTYVRGEAPRPRENHRRLTIIPRHNQQKTTTENRQQQTEDNRR